MESQRQYKSCFFIGHRDAPEALRFRLEEAVERHITQYGVAEFVVGRYGHFDEMCAAAGRAARKKHPEIVLLRLTPYYLYKDVQWAAPREELLFYPPGMEQVPKRCAIVRANAYMLRHSDYLICYCKDQIGNTRELVQQAMGRERRGLLRVENLALSYGSFFNPSHRVP